MGHHLRVRACDGGECCAWSRAAACRWWCQGRRWRLRSDSDRHDGLRLRLRLTSTPCSLRWLRGWRWWRYRYNRRGWRRLHGACITPDWLVQTQFRDADLSPCLCADKLGCVVADISAFIDDVFQCLP